MKLEGTYTFDAPKDVVWEALMNPEVLAKIMPGCEELEEIGENEYKTTLKIKVGPVQGKFQGAIKLLDIQAPESYNMQVDGKGSTGFMKGSGGVRLEAQGDSTLMHYSGDAQVGGRIASVGQRLLDSSAKALTKQSLDGLHQQIKMLVQAEAEPKIEVASNAPTPTSRPSVISSHQIPEVKGPSQTEFAMGVAKNMLEDIVRPERQPAVIMGGLGILLLIMILNWWMNAVARKAAYEVLERRGRQN